jgi:aldehyde dehydrogenase (NAD+)
MSQIMEYQHFINGQWAPGETGETMNVLNPSTQEVVAHVPRGSNGDVDKAVASAKEAFESGVWANKSAEERADILLRAAVNIAKNKDKLAYLEALTSGSTIRRTMSIDVNAVTDALKNAANCLKSMPLLEHAMCLPWYIPQHSYFTREPIGVCAGITPWNFPMILAAWKFAPALAMGNSIVMKPASITPVTLLELAKIIHESGVPAGVFNVVTGPGSSAGNHLASHPDVGKIGFTGSTEVGRQIAHLAADSIKRVTLELGGKSPTIVLDDADLDMASSLCIHAFLYHTGQVCESGTRMIVPRKMQDQLVALMIEKIKKLTIGNQMDPTTLIGPIASAEQLKTIMNYVDIGKKEGAQIALGGNRLGGPKYEKGFFYEPTIFVGCNNKMKQVREEIFGPVQCVLPYDDVEEAIAIANDSPYGLGGSICSTNISRAELIAKKLRTGTVWINTHHMLRADAPFGGYKESGYGRENCYHALMAYSEVKHTCASLVPDASEYRYFKVIGLN